MADRKQDRRRKNAQRRRRAAPSLAARLLLGLVTLSILFPALAGSLAARSFQQTGVFEDRIVICTGSGLKVIFLDASGEPVSGGEDHPDFATGLCAPMATAALAEFRDDLFTRLRPPRVPDLPRPAAAILVPHGTEHPPSLTTGPPVFV
ncbi:MAG: hypothetical protein AMXMBFR74_26020 [Parvibaculum sp.]|uniref:hypothetical protein n=1 Tax=Parvibaculum sp. TaxID=2024848 RepID=UPI0035BB4D1D